MSAAMRRWRSARGPKLPNSGGELLPRPRNSLYAPLRHPLGAARRRPLPLFPMTGLPDLNYCPVPFHHADVRQVTARLSTAAASCPGFTVRPPPNGQFMGAGLANCSTSCVFEDTSGDAVGRNILKAPLTGRWGRLMSRISKRRCTRGREVEWTG
jgi:hypothetical protein